MTEQDTSRLFGSRRQERGERGVKGEIEEIGAMGDEAASRSGGWPKGIKYLVWNEFCERFSFYGLKTILALFMLDYLHLSETSATELVHLFIVMCYATPLLGAVLSDGFLLRDEMGSAGASQTLPNLEKFFHLASSEREKVRESNMLKSDKLVVGWGSEEISEGVRERYLMMRRTSADQSVGSFTQGKYRTILYLSMVYGVGNWVLTSAALADTSSGVGATTAFWATAAGLFLIGLGTGGIKPCVTAFGGDQIDGTLPDGPVKERLQRSFFSLYYAAINAGAVISTLLTPLLREYYSYSLAFAIPAMLMMVAVFIFWLGNQFYVKRAPQGNVFAEVGSTVYDAVKLQVTSKKPNPERQPLLNSDGTREDLDSSSPLASWLDIAIPKHGSTRVEDIKSLIRVVIVLLPVPMFWCLSDQQSSKWIFQGADMKLNLPRWVGGFTVQPDQMQALNPILVLVMIPIFDQLIYPFLESRRVPLKPIVRLWMGLLLGAVAFVISGLLQIWLDNSPPATISILWQIPQNVIITAGEILLSITGLEFAYSQAPLSMKSIVQSVWLFTVAGGNIFTIIVVAAIGTSLSKATEFFIFAVLAVVAAFAMIWLSSGFKYKQEKYVTDPEDPHHISSEEIASTMT